MKQMVQLLQGDESESWGISYAVNENMTIAYGERDYDDNTSSGAVGSLEQMIQVSQHHTQWVV